VVRLSACLQQNATIFKPFPIVQTWFVGKIAPPNPESTPMTTIVIVQVREQSADFRGVTAHVVIQGDGSPEQFEAAMNLARQQAGETLGTAWVGSSPYPAPATQALESA
jgi:hypothetical protein